MLKLTLQRCYASPNTFRVDRNTFRFSEYDLVLTGLSRKPVTFRNYVTFIVFFLFTEFCKSLVAITPIHTVVLPVTKGYIAFLHSACVPAC